jgi:oxygen-dependent protoporphyrinogen oxidase
MRWGTEVARRMVDPLLAGVRGGRLEHISLAAAAPDIDGLARGHRSVSRALRTQGPPEAPVFVAPRAGMETLTSRLVDRLPDVRTNNPVERMVVTKGRVEVDRSAESYDAAVVAVPAFAAARMLDGIEPAAAKLLHTIEYASVASIALVYPRSSARVPADGSGFLVPSDSDLRTSACTWYSAKWPAIGTDDRIVVRAVVGRAGTDPVLDLDDAALIERVHHDLHEVMGVEAPPLATRVTRWDRSIPQYAVGHLELVAKIEAGLAAAGPVFITGAGYRGSGIPDCIAQAHATAATIDGRLGGTGG